MGRANLRRLSLLCLSLLCLSLRCLIVLAVTLPGGPVMAADLSVDGVPLPADAKLATIAVTGSAELQRWAGVWIGSWGGDLKHILLIESVTADGHANVVYAIGDNPSLGISREWTRFPATISGTRLTIDQGAFTAAYDLKNPDELMATYTRGNLRAHAIMTRADFTSLTRPGAPIEWTRGKSEFLQTDLVEGATPVRLEAVIFRPRGDGPFPLAVINHGSTGQGTDPALFKRTWDDPVLANFLNERGWIVAFPQRRGRGRSDGLYDEGFSQDRALGYTCDLAISLAGADRALQDIEAAITALRRERDVAPSRILIGGQSRGGALAIAYAGTHPEQIAGVINFVGGWVGTGCDTASRLNQALLGRGAMFKRPTLWLYGHHDPFYQIQHSRDNFAAFQNAGGQGTFLEFDVPGGYGHGVINFPELWEEPVTDCLNSLAPLESR